MIDIKPSVLYKAEQVSLAIRDFAQQLSNVSDPEVKEKNRQIYSYYTRLRSRTIFDMLFIGKLWSGKSTLINALAGKFVVSSKTACTPLVMAYSYGEDTNCVYVYYKDQENPRRMTLEQFAEEFKWTTEDDVSWTENGEYVDRFADVLYAEVHNREEIFASGIRLIETPDIYYFGKSAKITELVHKSNVIVFLLNAVSLFSEKEKQYISVNFAGKHMRNLFFVVNRINQVTGEEEIEKSVKPKVKDNLREVFTDENGCFDEELYNSRVFFVDEYGALCASTGQPYKVYVGSKEIEIPFAKEELGIFEFENALSSYLNSGECFEIVFDPILHEMATVYAVNAVNKKSNEADVLLDEVTNKLSKIANDFEDKILVWADIFSEYLASRIFLEFMLFISNYLRQEYAPTISANSNILAMAEYMIGAKYPLINVRKEREYRQEFINIFDRLIDESAKELSSKLNSIIADEVCKDALFNKSEEYITKFDDQINCLLKTFFSDMHYVHLSTETMLQRLQRIHEVSWNQQPSLLEWLMNICKLSAAKTLNAIDLPIYPNFRKIFDDIGKSVFEEMECEIQNNKDEIYEEIKNRITEKANDMVITSRQIVDEVKIQYKKTLSVIKF